MDFSPLAAYLDALWSAYRIPGCQCVVFQSHKPLFSHVSGFRDAARTQPVQGDELYWLYSGTKLTTCTAAMRLIQEGHLALDAPVSHYLPEWNHLTVRDKNGVRPLTEPLTVRHLMTMTGGLSYCLDIPALAVLHDTDADTRHVVSTLASVPLDFIPGTHFQYSMCHDVLAAVMEQAADCSFRDYLQQTIFQPLGMTCTDFYPTPEQRSHFAQQYDWDDAGWRSVPCPCENNYQLSHCYTSGGAGLFTCSADYSRLLDTLACGGTSPEGYSLLRPDTIDAMRTNQMGTVQLADFQQMRPGYGYGLGVRTRISPPQEPGLACDFGWDGAAGCYLLIDPVRHISMLYLQHIRCQGVVYDEVHPMLRKLLSQCLTSE